MAMERQKLKQKNKQTENFRSLVIKHLYPAGPN